jgi:pyruvate,water dikinase
MVRARAAGVAMTLNPINGDRSKIVIDSSFGLGETVVGGLVTPDNFVVDKVMLEVVKRTISTKHVELVVDDGEQRTIERPIERERQQEPSLTLEEVKAVARLAKLAEQHYGSPQDVEWALDTDGDNKALLLQSRPETVWSQAASATRPATYETGLASVLSTLMNPLAAKKKAN